MKYEEMIDLFREVEKSGVEAFELQQGDFRMFIRKPQRQSHSYAEEREEELEEIQEPAKEAVSIQDGTIIRSPMVGIFHTVKEGTAPAPGDRVEEGQILGAIEAMKLMNDVVSICAGMVTEVLVKDQELVEYGQPLFVIEE